MRSVAVRILMAIIFVNAPSLAQTTHAAGEFDLTITKSAVLAPGKHHLASKSATLTYTNEFMLGRVNAFKIEMPAGDRQTATWVLLLDRADHITEASLTISVPGTTVARTVAYTRADIDKYFSDATYANGRLRLKSKGRYATGADSPDEILTMSWDVDLDAPVVKRQTP